jgi:hypothetical protein
MTLRARLARLKAKRPALDAVVPFELKGLPPDVLARITSAMADGW